MHEVGDVKKSDAGDRTPMSDVIKTFRSGKSHQFFGSTILIGKETLISDNHKTNRSKIAGDGTQTISRTVGASPIDFTEIPVKQKPTTKNKKRQNKAETARPGKNRS